MDESKIRGLVGTLGAGTTLEQERTRAQLKPLGPKVLPYFLEAYPRMKKGPGRVSLLFHSIKFARTHPEAFELGVLGLADKSTLARYRACGLLAYSLRKDALPHLKALLNHPDRKTLEDAKAAIDAIQKGNHHLFVDRTHSGRVFWEVQADGSHGSVKGNP